MKYLITSIVAAFFLLSGCTYTRTVNGTTTYKGERFTIIRTSTEDAANDETLDYQYTIVFPDGTRKTTVVYNNIYRASRAREALMDRWLSENRPSASVPANPTPASGGAVANSDKIDPGGGK